MKIKEFAQIFETDFPLSYAFDGDNVGLLVGDRETEISKILVCCDVDYSVVEEAVSKGCNLILSHHPVMFRPVNRMTETEPEQKAIRLAIKEDIAIYSAHTNLDSGRGGLNDYMASLLGMENTEVIDVCGKDDRGEYGFGRICDLEKPASLGDIMNQVIHIFDADGLRYAGDEKRLVRRIAVNSGGGADVIPLCIERNCDLLITGDIKYNGYRDAVEKGMCIVDIMHYDSEHIVMDWFMEYILKKGIDITVYKSEKNINLIKSYNYE